jgi:O-acetyl-ADP-ribose deacetylase (regulator of RNase III)
VPFALLPGGVVQRFDALDAERFYDGFHRDLIMEWKTADGKILRLVIGDITRVPADAIVNAANSALAGGGGVDGAIHAAGGPNIMRELDGIRAKIGRCPTGSAVVTGAGNLPAKHIFHAVGPVYRDGKRGEPAQLASCYRTCLDLAEQHSAQKVTFPSISTGIYGYPMAEAAAIALKEVVRHLSAPGATVQEVIFVLYDQRAYDVFRGQATQPLIRVII